MNANPMPGLRDFAKLTAIGALGATVALGLLALAASLFGFWPVTTTVAFVAGLVLAWLIGRAERDALLERAHRAESAFALELAIQRNPFPVAGLPLDGVSASTRGRQAGGSGEAA